MIRSRLGFLLISLLFAACAAKIPYSTDYPLTAERFRSRDNAFSGLVPKGWVASQDDTLARNLAAWLIPEDFSSNMTFQELHLDQLSVKQVSKEGLQLLAQLSMALDMDSSSIRVYSAPREFEIQHKKFCSYEIARGKNRTRIVVFGVAGRYYECKAIPTGEGLSESELVRLFTVQQALLSSLSF